MRYLPVLIEIALMLYALFDCMNADPQRVRNLPKPVWFAAAILVPFAGPIAWLVFGRPVNQVGAPQQPREVPPVFGPQGRPEFRQPPGVPRRPTPRRPVAPDDDPAFLEDLEKRRRRQEALEAWEDELRRREEELKRRESGE